MKSNKITVDYIKKMVADKLNVNIDVYEAKTRKREYIEAKHIAIYLCDKNIRISEKNISAAFFLKSHSNVITTRKKIDGFIQTNRDYNILISSLQNEIDSIKEYNSIDVINTYILGKSIN